MRTVQQGRSGEIDSEHLPETEANEAFENVPENSARPVTQAPKKCLKVLHIITGLNTGGAEVMLRELLRFAQPDFQHEVISLSDIGAVGKSIQDMGISVRALNMRAGIPDVRGIVRLTREIRRIRPDVVQTWLYHADVIGGIAAHLAGVRSVAWGLHISHLDPKSTKKSTLLMVRLGALLSRVLPSAIVCCAQSTRQLHVERGYTSRKMRVIFNGFDLSRFKPDVEARASVRQELGIPSDAPLIGLIGRFHPQKDHANFIKAARIMAYGQPDTYFLLCGEGCVPGNRALTQPIAKARLRARFRLLGRRDDTAKIMAGLDILSLASSYGEAFPMVVGEAMACGVPVVVTDVGDCAFLVDSCGRVVPPDNAQLLARAWGELMYMSPARRTHLGERGRARIAEEFSIEKVSAHYHALYREMMCAHCGGGEKCACGMCASTA